MHMIQDRNDVSQLGSYNSEEKLYRKWKKFMAFFEEWEDLPEVERDPDKCSKEALNDLEEEVESKRVKRDLLNRKVIDDYYHQQERRRAEGII